MTLRVARLEIIDFDLRDVDCVSIGVPESLSLSGSIVLRGLRSGVDVFNLF